MRKPRTSFLLLTAAALQLRAQQLPLNNLYPYQPLQYNAAFTGILETGNVFITQRSQWKNYPGSPQTMIFGMDAPIRSGKDGVGAVLFDHHAGFMALQGVHALYAHQVDLSETDRLRFGIGFGFMNTRIDFTQAQVKDVDDPFLLTADLRRTVPDAQAGLLYKRNELELGISSFHLFANAVNFTEPGNASVLQISRTFLFSAGERFYLDQEKMYTFSPLVIFRAGASAPGVDVNAVFGMQNAMWVGLFYRSSTALGMQVRATIYKKLGAGYCYSLLLGEPGISRGSSHEIMLTYSFTADHDKKQSDKTLEKYRQDIDALNLRVQALSDSLKTTSQPGGQDLRPLLTQLSEELEKLKKETTDANAALKMQVALLEEKVNLLVKLIGN
jgi:type IX secretion system PorP/SprF family membrane protein